MKIEERLEKLATIKDDALFDQTASDILNYLNSHSLHINAFMQGGSGETGILKFTSQEAYQTAHEIVSSHTESFQKAHIPLQRSRRKIKTTSDPKTKEKTVELIQQSDRDGVITSLSDMNNLINETIQKIFEFPRDSIKENNPDFEKLKHEVITEFKVKIDDEISGCMESVNNDLTKIKDDVTGEIKKGLQRLTQYKAELGLEGGFKNNLENDNTTCNTAAGNYRKLFVYTVAGAPILLLFSGSLIAYSIDIALTSALFHVFIVLVIPATTLIFFFHKQYKLNQNMTIRYRHLLGFTGGGAEYINIMLGTDNSETLDETHRRLADLFMDPTFIYGEAKSSSLFTDKLIEKAVEIVTKIRQ